MAIKLPSASRNGFEIAFEPGVGAVRLFQAELQSAAIRLALHQRRDIGRHCREVLGVDQSRPSVRLRLQLRGLVAVAADVCRHEDQRVRLSRPQPIDDRRARLHDAVGIGEHLQTPQRCDRRTDQFGQDFDGVDFGARPVVRAAAIIEADDAIQLALDKNRNRQCRLDAERLQKLAHRWLEIASPPGDRFAPCKNVKPGDETGLLHTDGEIIGWQRNSRRVPAIGLRQHIVFRRLGTAVAQKDVQPVHAGRLTDPFNDLGQRRIEVGRAQQLLGTVGDGLQDDIAPMGGESVRRTVRPRRGRWRAGMQFQSRGQHITRARRHRNFGARAPK